MDNSYLESFRNTKTILKDWNDTEFLKYWEVDEPPKDTLCVYRYEYENGEPVFILLSSNRGFVDRFGFFRTDYNSLSEAERGIFLEFIYTELWSD